MPISRFRDPSNFWTSHAPSLGGQKLDPSTVGTGNQTITGALGGVEHGGAIGRGTPGAPKPGGPSAPGAPTRPTISAAQFIAQWQQSHNASEGIGPLRDAMIAAGYNVSPFVYGPETGQWAGPSNNELLVDGVKTKIVAGEGSNQSWYAAGTNDSPGGGGGDPGGFGGAGSGYGGFNRPPGPYQAPPFTAPAPYQIPAFTAPTGVTEQNDPGYLFRLQEGRNALEGAAAAKGSLLSGGALKALDRYTQDYASGEFGNVYNRALQGFGANTTAGQFGYQTNAGHFWKPQELGAQYGLAGYETNVGTQRNAMNDYWNRLQGLYQGGQDATRGTSQPPPA